MKYIRLTLRKSLVGIAALLALSMAAPAGIAMAATADTCTPPASTTPGVHVPTGSDASTYTYVCDPSSQYYGEWVNPYYVFNPNTDDATPLYAPDYSYNCTTGKWSKIVWSYDPASSQFDSNRVDTSAPADMSTDCPIVAPTTSSSGTSGDSSGSSSDPSTNGTTGASSANDISDTGPGSDNTSNLTGDNSLTDNNTTDGTILNGLSGTATSGNALVQSNTTGGSATSGEADNTADVINLLQSATNALGAGSNVATFTYNVNGDVNGNLLLDPSSLLQDSGPNSTNSTNSDLNNSVTVNNASTGTINNNVNLTADSGNAKVSDNTTAGNATSGNADNIANIVNSIDSLITSGQSFIGTININGNLNGNILLPSDFVNQMLADNVPTVTITGPSSTNSADTTVNNNTTVTNTNNQGINNNVTGDATSGNATVSGNTSAGSATSGSATTNITAFNLTGSQVIGANDLLVFVNVAGGSWVGLILNAPAGSTAAELGGGITSSGPDSSNTSNSTVNNNANLSNTSNEAINNNITTDAKSGNATVSDNTTGGSATSGDADNAVNLLNVENSSLNLSGWFGILFINVFGTWNGNLGTYTPGVSDGTYNSSVSHASSTSGGSNSGSPAAVSVFRFAPNTSGNSASPFTVSTNSGSGASSSNNVNNLLLASSKEKKSGNGTSAPQPLLQSSKSGFKLTFMIAAICAAFLLGDAILSFRRRMVNASHKP